MSFSYSSLILTALIPSGLLAQQSPLQIDWGTSTIADTIVDSNGDAISVDDYAIELGGFAAGFVPTAANIGDWVNNWQVFDAVTAADTDTADSFVAGTGTDARFVGSALLDTDQTSLSEDGNGVDVFEAGSQAYVFVRNQDEIGPDSEWLLYTSESGEDWEFPSVTGTQTQFPLTWFVSEVDTVLFGAANTTIVGDGEFTDTSPNFVLRTHTFVPEPSTSLLLLGASLGLVGRRRRGSH